MDRNILMEANELRRNKQYALADSKYDYLLAKEPANIEYIFNKALNIKGSNPIKAIEMFAMVFRINPNINGTKENIMSITIDFPKDEVWNKAINVFSELFEINPTNLDLAYLKASVIGNRGKHLEALLEYYRLIDLSIFPDNPEEFEKSPIFKDIDIMKIHLRSKTQFDGKIEFPIPNEEEIRDSVIKEYNYFLPTTDLSNKNYLFDFGKYLGQTTKEILSKDPRYFIWCIENVNSFCVSEDILEIIKNKRISIEKAKNINLFKLSLVREKIRTINVDPNKPLPEIIKIDKNGNLIN